MSPYTTIKITLTCLLLAFLGSKVMAQDALGYNRYDEQVNLICNYEHVPLNFKRNYTISNLLNRYCDGFILKLDKGRGDTIYYKTSSQKQELSVFCDSIYQFLHADTSKVVTLFFDYNFPVNRLRNYLQQQKLYGLIWNEAVDKEWPVNNVMLSSNKPLVCFDYNPRSSENNTIRYIWDYAAKPCYSIAVSPEINGEYCEGEIDNKLLYLANYQLKSNRDFEPTRKIIYDTNIDPFFVSHSFNVWKNTGKQVNFLIFDALRENYSTLKWRLYSQKKLQGTISYNREALNKVYWEGSFSAVTNGNYCFPGTFSEDILLRPKAPGFRFVPEEINIESIENDITQNFIAIPLSLKSNMVANFSYNESVNDKGSNNFKVLNNGAKLVNDKSRNQVLELDGNSFITLPKANELGISNSDFTVSAWVKIARENTRNKRDFSLLGTQETFFRGGLHLQIRDNKPYFGFFSNDLMGNTTLSPQRWYHIVWRYSKYNEEQAIYINGKLDGASLHHPAFVSNANIYIGRSINMNNLFEGRIDDLIIWDRALGEEEIWGLYQGVTIHKGNTYLNLFKQYTYLLISAFILVILILLVLIRRKGTKSQSRPISRVVEPEALKSEFPICNTIQLFGDFKAVNAKGEDVTMLFTPRLKQIFIYLVLKSQVNEHGVSSDSFLEDIWPGFDRKKAINNRGVSISKLRNLLSAFDTISIINHQERWRVVFSDKVYCDFHTCALILKKNLFDQRENLGGFLTVVQRGVFLNDCTDSSIDTIKGDFANKVIDALTRLFDDIDLRQNPELVIQIAERILATDDLNEEALAYKIKALLALQQTNQAKYLYKSFKERYEIVYGTPFTISFENLVH